MLPKTLLTSTVVTDWTALHAEVRDNIRAWLRHYRDTTEWTHDRLAQFIGLSEPTVTQTLNGKAPGLDMLIHLSTAFRIEASRLMYIPPEKAAKEAIPGTPADPSSASRATAQAGKHRTGGGSK
jgi:transcriptional regulator with XRE-family HTH domain